MTLNNKDEIKIYLCEDSGLPGARANLRKVTEFSNLVSKSDKSDDTFKFIEELWNSSSDGNDPNTILVLSGLLGSSHFYKSKHHSKVLQIFISAMNDSRWRVREIIQESLKVIANDDYQEFINLCETIDNPTLLEHRAILTTIAHPEILKTDQQNDYALKKLEDNFKTCIEVSKLYNKKDEAFDAYTKGMNFAPSVIIANNPEKGFALLNKYVNKSSELNRIIKENLKKNRLLKYWSDECENLLNKITL